MTQLRFRIAAILYFKIAETAHIVAHVTFLMSEPSKVKLKRVHSIAYGILASCMTN